MSSQTEAMHCDVRTTEPHELTYSWFFNENTGAIAAAVAQQMGVNVASISRPGETTGMHRYFHVKNIRRERPAPAVSSKAVGSGQTRRQRDVAVDEDVASNCGFIVQRGEVCIGFKGFPDKKAKEVFEKAVSIACTEHGEHNWRPLKYKLLDVGNFLFGDLVDGVREVGQSLIE